MTEHILIKEILSLSYNKTNWEEAKKEWNCSHITLTKEPERCLCTHYPIKELCHMTNQLTGSYVIVGNCCVTKFMDERIGRIFAALKDNRVNKDTINLAHEIGIITPMQKQFMIDVHRKRSLTESQEKAWNYNKELVLKKLMKRK